jgi:T5SS/PEP-CTERM-associated repeat protein
VGGFTTTNDLTGNFALNSLSFTNTSGTITLASNALDFSGTAPSLTLGAGNALISAPVNNLAAGATGVNLPVTLNLNGAGNLTLTGTLGGNVMNSSAAAGSNFYFGFVGAGTGAGTLTFNAPGTSTTGYFHLGNASTVITGGGTYNLAADANDTPTPPTSIVPLRSALVVGTASGQVNTFTLSGGTTLNVADNAYFGGVAGSTTTALITGTGTVLNIGTTINGVPPISGRFGPGNAGTGNVTISAGAQVNAFFLFNARLAGSGGTVIIDGAGSQLNIITQAGIVNSGQFSVGNQSTGALTIQNGGSAIGRNAVIGNTALDAGAGTGAGNGFITVTGTGSLLTIGGALAQNSAGQITVGSSGNGRLDVLAGGVVNLNTDGAVTPAGGNLFSAVNASINTTLTSQINVSGTGTQLNIAGQMSLSGGGGATVPGGAATMTIGTGGAVTVGGAALLGQSPVGGTATLNVTGANSRLTVTGQFQSNPATGSNTSTANISVQSGGTLTVNNTAFLGVGTGSTTTLAVDGTGSVFQTTGTGQLQLGGAGTTPGGTVTTTIGAGGTVRSATLLVLFGGASTTVNANGTLSAGALADGMTGTSVGNLTNNGAVTILGGVSQTYTGIISGTGTLAKSGTGAQNLGAANTYSGATTITGGGLFVTNTTGSGTGTGSVTVGVDGLLGGTGRVAPDTGVAANNTVIVNGLLRAGTGDLLTTGTLTLGSPTTATTVALTGAGSGYVFDLGATNTGTATPGPNGGSTVTAGTSNNLLRVQGTAGTSLTFSPSEVIINVSTTAPLLNFDNTQYFSWLLGEVDAGVLLTVGPAPAFDTSIFVQQNPTGSGAFFLSQAGTQIFLNFSPVPEPTSWFVIVGVGIAWYGRRRGAYGRQTPGTGATLPTDC